MNDKQKLINEKAEKLAESARKTKDKIFMNAISSVGNHELYVDGLKRRRKEIDDEQNKQDKQKNIS